MNEQFFWQWEREMKQDEDARVNRPVYVHRQGDGEIETVYSSHTIDVYDDELYAQLSVQK